MKLMGILIFGVAILMNTINSYGAFIDDFSPKGPSIAVVSVGTFGPITLRHEEIFESMLKEMKETYPGFEIAIFVIANDMTVHKRGQKKPLDLHHRVNLLAERYGEHPNIYVLDRPRSGAFAQITKWIRNQSATTRIFGHVGADSFVGLKNRLGALIMKWVSPSNAKVEKWIVTHATPEEKEHIDSQANPRFAGKPSQLVSTPTQLDFDIHATDVREKYWLLNKNIPLPAYLDVPLVSDLVEQYILENKLLTQARFKPKASLCSFLFK
tara:strand:- start:10300 stop:11103 length:804 start_codon:yes stop_codon:yes gene_type:complete